MNKKIIALLLIGCLSTFMASCKNTADDTNTATKEESSTESAEAAPTETKRDLDSITLNDISIANAQEELFKRHDSISVQAMVVPDSTYNFQAELYTFNSVYHYITKDYVYSNLDYEGLYDDDDSISQDSIIAGHTGIFKKNLSNGGSEYAYSWYAMNDDDTPLPAYNAVTFSTVQFNESYNETLTGIDDNGDGTITVHTTVSLNETPEVQSVPDNFENAIMNYAYVLDYETLELLSLKCYINNNNEEISFLEETVEYDVAPPEVCEELVEKLKTTDIIGKDDNNSRTITVIYDPGTDQEETFQIKVDNNYRVYTIPKDGYEFYKDPEGKELPTAGDGKSDSTLYALPQ